MSLLTYSKKGLGKMNHILVVVDMQRDFVDGALGTKEAEAIVDNVVKKIRDFDGEIFVTYDTHGEDYLETNEGRHLPIAHCVKGTDGWKLDARVQAALEEKTFVPIEKITFGSLDLPIILEEHFNTDEICVELIGLCTDICVVSNALLLKAHYPQMPIFVDASCCAGVTREKHLAALEVMRSCQIDIKE